MISVALSDFQKILHEIDSTDSVNATSKVKTMAAKLKGQYNALFQRVCTLVGDVEKVDLQSIEISINTQPLDIDNI